MAAPAPTMSQLALNLRRRPILFQSSPHLPLPRAKVLIAMSVGGGGQQPEFSTSEIKTNLSYTADESKSHAEEAKPHDTDLAKAYGTAKIHDFCFGIPYGGLVLSGGFLGFLFSRNPTTLSTGVLFGGALLALSLLSLKIWRQGKSSIPFVLGQAVLSAALFWKNIQAYSLTKKVIPTGFYVVISAAMLCFYSYVMVSGGNPPPKKLQSSTVGS